jgi:hypothetical protein
MMQVAMGICGDNAYGSLKTVRHALSFPKARIMVVPCWGKMAKLLASQLYDVFLTLVSNQTLYFWSLWFLTWILKEFFWSNIHIKKHFMGFMHIKMSVQEVKSCTQFSVCWRHWDKRAYAVSPIMVLSFCDGL